MSILKLMCLGNMLFYICHACQPNNPSKFIGIFEPLTSAFNGDGHWCFPLCLCCKFIIACTGDLARFIFKFIDWDYLLTTLLQIELINPC